MHRRTSRSRTTPARCASRSTPTAGPGLRWPSAARRGYAEPARRRRAATPTALVLATRSRRRPRSRGSASVCVAPRRHRADRAVATAEERTQSRPQGTLDGRRRRPPTPTSPSTSRNGERAARDRRDRGPHGARSSPGSSARGCSGRCSRSRAPACPGGCCYALPAGGALLTRWYRLGYRPLFRRNFGPLSTVFGSRVSREALPQRSSRRHPGVQRIRDGRERLSRACRPRAALRRGRRQRRLDGRDGRLARARRAPTCCRCRSTSASAARSRPGSSTPRRTATATWSRSTATASTSRRRSRRCRRRWAPTRRSTSSAARASCGPASTSRRSRAAPASTSSRSCSRGSSASP